MLALIRKDLGLYFSNLSGFLITGLFLLLTGLFLWVIPGNWNIFTVGYASLDGLFELAPWLYLFLVPAIAMRLFADEYRLGTEELLMTSPLSAFKIVWAKYLSGLLVLLLSLLPTLIYYYSITQMAFPVGNVDHGAIVGSYLGLFMLAAVYLAVGVFASSLTDNQIIAFLTALALSYVLYAGLDFLTLISTSAFAKYLANGSIAAHYNELSKGVIVASDFIYFISTIALFLYFTQLKIKR